MCVAGQDGQTRQSGHQTNSHRLPLPQPDSVNGNSDAEPLGKLQRHKEGEYERIVELLATVSDIGAMPRQLELRCLA